MYIVYMTNYRMIQGCISDRKQNLPHQNFNRPLYDTPFPNFERSKLVARISMWTGKWSGLTILLLTCEKFIRKTMSSNFAGREGICTTMCESFIL